jgi:hypothetical protein
MPVYKLDAAYMWKWAFFWTSLDSARHIQDEAGALPKSRCRISVTPGM